MTKARGNGNGANRLIPIPDFLADSWINTSWWRCSRCLRRVYVDVHYYHCPDCNLSCEPERKEYREKLRQAEAQKQSKHGTPVIKSE